MSEYRLESMPETYRIGDCSCRGGCGRQADKVVRAMGTNYAYPCCESEDCVEIVEARLKLEAPRKVDLPPKFWRPPWRWGQEESGDHA